MPWLVAGFLTMLWLVPFDAIDLPVDLPVDSKLDRLLLAAIALLWIAVRAATGSTIRLRSTPIFYGVMAFTAVAATSILVNVHQLALSEDLSIAVKRLALLFSFALFFAIVATTIRRSEIRAFSALFVGLGCLAAIGTIYEYRTGTNVFFDWTRDLAPSGWSVKDAAPDPKFGRPNVTGPTGHGLAIATMLSITLPFCVTGIMAARRQREQILYGLATAIIAAGTVATLRKTSFMAPAAALLVLLAYRPRHMFRLLPLGIVLALFVQVLSPGATVKVKAQFINVFQRNTTVGRTTDYDAVEPDVDSNPLLGRGAGSYDPFKYRILDNELLALLIETGAIGVTAYLGMMLLVVLAVHPTVRRWDPVRGPPALAAAGGAAAYALSSSLYDVLSFPHAPYMFFFVAGLAVVCSVQTRQEQQAAEESAAFAAERRLIAPEPVELV